MEVKCGQGRTPTREQRSGAWPCPLQQGAVLLSRKRLLVEGTLDLGAPAVHVLEWPPGI